MAQRVALPYSSYAGLSSNSASASVSQEAMGSVGIQSVPQARGLHNIQTSGKQAELMERLKQLRAWQQQQQAELLRRQREQLLKLRSEQTSDDPVMVVGGWDNSSATGDAVRRGTRDSEISERDHGGPPCSESRSPPRGALLPREADSDGRLESVEGMHCQEGLDQECRGSHDGEYQIEEECVDNRQCSPLKSQGALRHSHQTHEERPVQPVVGDFEQFLEKELSKSGSPLHVSHRDQASNHQPKKFSFLRRGEGIARFGVKSAKRVKPKKSAQKLRKPPSSSSNKENVNPRPELTQVSEPPVAYVGQQPRVRKVARGQWSNEPPSGSVKPFHVSFPRVNTPTMVRCGSEDSFIFRRDDRVRREEEELREFELLELAAVSDIPGHASSSSCPTSSPIQSSLGHAPPTFDVPLSPRSSQSPSDQPNMFYIPSGALASTARLNVPQGNISDYEMDENLQVLTNQHFQDDRTPTGNQQTKEGAPDLMTNLQHQVDDRDLDETLTGPSLVAEVDFNDEEEWHSFSQGSPVGQSKARVDFDGLETPNGSMLSVDVGASWSPPVKREQLNDQGRPVFQSPLPSATLSSAVKRELEGNFQQHSSAVDKPSTSHDPCSVSDKNEPRLHSNDPPFGSNISDNPAPPATLSNATATSSLASFVGPPDVGVTNSHQPTGHAQFHKLPPPSALVARLFPALRKEKRPLDLTVNPKKRTPGQVEDKVPSPTSSVGGDSGKGSMAAGSSAASVMNEELRSKLCLLETEIERFKSENASLEKLRKEKEEGLSHLKKEITEFKRQKEEEMARFEEYKKEEIKKLKKERKMFETFQQQARSARDKKDKEEILILKNELEGVRDEFRQRESRWGATQSRLRLRIQSLEKENQELRNDLKMMEQTRLQMWQRQMEQEMEQAKRKKVGRHTKSVTPESLDDDQRVSDGYQSDGESSDLSVRAEEIANLVLEEDGINDSDGGIRNSTPCEDELLRDHFPLDRGKKSSTTEDEGKSKPATSNRRVCFSTSPKSKSRHASASPSKTVIQSARQQRASPRKKLKAKPSPLPVKVGEVDGTKRHGVNSEGEGTVNVKQAESIQEDGSRVILFPNGTRKIISCNGKSTSVHFFNGDVKHVKPDQTVVYFYAESKTTHTTYSDGLEVFDFPNGQCEKHYPDGTKEIAFPDKTLKYVYPSGDEETNFPDGTVQKVLPNGDMTLFYANGQREIYTKDFKRREYPDGTVKTVYPDGRQETRYASGRVRMKDKDGRMLFDKLPDA